MNEGRLISNRGLDIAVQEYDDYFEEQHIEYTHALHSTIRGRGAYLAGPMARYNLNAAKLSPLTREVAADIGFGAVCRNPFQSIIVRSIEVLYAFDEALRLLDEYQPPAQPYIETTPAAATGYAVTEAPRGLLYHRYSIDTEGTITDAKIVPPTSQNQKSIEEDLQQMIPAYLHLPEEQLRLQCEQSIRNYDPCISCATHFLKLHLEKTG